MGKILTGDQLRRACKKLGEIERQLGQNEYPYEPEELIVALQALTEGRFNAVGGSAFPSLLFASSLIPEYTDEQGNKKKWEVVKDVLPSNFSVGDLEIVAFLEEGDDPVNGYEMCLRALALKANMGLVDAKRMLDNVRDIPVSFQGKCLVFTGTKLRDPGGRLCVPCIYFGGDRWCLGFRGVSLNWDDRDRLPRCK